MKPFRSPSIRPAPVTPTPLFHALLLASVIGLTSQPVLAAEWVASTPGSWFDGTNWAGGSAPTDEADVNNGGIVNYEGTADIGFINIGVLDNGSGTLNMVGNSAFNGLVVLSVGNGAGASGNLSVSGPDARLLLSNSVYLGSGGGPGVGGTAQVTVSDGARLEASRVYLDGGSITVSGQDSLLQARRTLGIAGGNGSDVTMTISDQGKVITGTNPDVNNRTSIAEFQNTRGRVTITGAGSVWQAQDPFVIIGGWGDATLILSDGGKMSAARLVVAQNPTGVASVIIGSPANAPGSPAAAGILDVGTIALGQGTGQLIFNFSGDPITYGGNVTGTGAIDLLAGDLTLTGTAARNVLTTVSGGSLKVNGTLNGNVNVGAGGVLGGTGTVGTTTLGNGATLAPGNPAGALRVAGNLSFDAGSTYRVQADPGSGASDRVIVTGTASLAGSVVHVGPDGGFAPQRIYTILSANTLNGNFEKATSTFAFLDTKLAYTDQDVTLELVRKPEPPVPEPGTPPTETPPASGGTIRFSDAANTGNQRAVANAIDSLPAGNPLHDYVLTLQEGLPPAVFDSLSGEAHASAKNTLLQGGTQSRSLVLNQLRANLQARNLPGAPTAAAGVSDLPPSAGSLPRSTAMPAWAQIVGNWQTLDGDGNAGRVRQHTGGLFVGADRAVGAGWRLGASLGYTDSNVRADSRASRSDVSSYSALLYGGRAFDTAWGRANLLLGGGYTWHDLSTRRQAMSQAAPLTADYGASTTQLFAELSHAWQVRASTTLEPFVGVAWANLRTRAFSEIGGPAALSGESDSSQQTTTTLGLRAAQAFELAGRPGRVYGTLGWRHLFGDDKGESRLAFQGSQSFTVAGAPIGRDAALVELGTELAMGRNAALGVSYAGQYASGSRDHTGMVNLRWGF
ncbi:Extracellular serine protease precursor [plant metagenome]|uniref:Extracellular serine protease n=1 Tax=plant metagenome TaxID=1297885 RepID=A0A484SW97_9ZZZZ